MNITRLNPNPLHNIEEPQMANTAQSQDSSTDVYQRLVQVIASGAVLFVGAGSSRKVGYPTWSELLDQLADAARLLDGAEVKKVAGADGLLRASAYKKVLGPEMYQRIICDTFAPRTPPHTAAHETLVAMPFRHIFTTNYDKVLQSAHQKVRGLAANSFDADEWDKLSELWCGQSAMGAARSYVHLHGSVERPQNIVLCKEEYEGRYYHELRYTEFLRAFLAGYRFVFVGFSLSDEEFKYILNWVQAVWKQSSPRHFAILPAPAGEDKQRIDSVNLRGLQGIEPVYFDNSSGDFASLWKLIEQLGRDVNAYSAKNLLVPVTAVNDIFTELFAEIPDQQQAALQRLPNLVNKYSIAASIADAGSGNSSDIDREIEATFKLVTRGLPDDAIAEYKSILERESNRLSAKQMYRLEANIGNALYSKGESTLASEAYLRAVSYFRDSRDAKGVELLGKFLEGDHAEAKRLATELLKSDPSFGRAWSIWVRAQDTRADFVEVETAIPDAMRKDAEVAQSLSYLASRCGQYDAHVAYARVAVEAAPKWPDALAMLGAAIISSEQRFLTFHADRERVPAHPELIAEAENSITSAINALGSRDPAGSLAGLFYNRSVARQLLDRGEDATRDLKEAFRLGPTEPAIALRFAMQAETQPDIDVAINALSKLSPKGEWGSHVQLAGIILRLRRNGEGDIAYARAESDQLCSNVGSVEPILLRASIVGTALQVCNVQGKAQDGIALVMAVADGVLTDHQRSVLLAKAYLQSGAGEEASKIARSVVAALGENASWLDRREAAKLAQDCELYSEAVRLWRTVIPANDVGSDTVHLVRSAFFAGEWRTVLDVCATVRAARRTTRRHLVAEVEVLAASRELARAHSLLKDWVTSHPNDKLAALHLSVLALHDGKPELAIFDETRLPGVSEITQPFEGVALVFVLRRGPLPMRALQVAYSLYRRFPDHPESNGALIKCVFDPSATPLVIERPVYVCEGAAVLVQELGGKPRWVYIESAPDPAASRGEFAPAHDFVKGMWGCSKGDKFEYLMRKYEVLDIQNGILRRVHEIMGCYEENFPSVPMLRRLSVPSAPPADATIETKLGDIYTELKKRERRRELLESMYRANRLPITTFALMLGRRVFDLVRYLTSDRTMVVHADDGEATRWPQALTAVRKSTELVLDGTVLAGALELDIIADLPNIGFKLVVPQAVLDELREISLEAGSTRPPNGTLGINRGKLFFFQPSPEQIAKEVGRIESIIQFVQSNCEVVGGECVLDLPKELKEKLEKILDTTSADAVAIAIKRGSPLWTDDLGLQQLVVEFGVDVSTVWTQSVMRVAMDRSLISENHYNQILGRLLDCGYEFTRLSADEMVAVLQHANWQVDHGPGEALIRNICEVALMNVHNQFITALFIKDVWTKCPHKKRAKAIIVSILEKIGRRHSQVMLASFIYRFRGIRQTAIDPVSWASGSAGTVDGNRKARRVDYTLDPFADRQSRSLKRFLRSWRSRSNEFKPNKTRFGRK